MHTKKQRMRVKQFLLLVQFFGRRKVAFLVVIFVLQNKNEGEKHANTKAHII